MTRLNLIQGTLDLIVLEVLTERPLHGYGIAQRIQDLSKRLLQVEEGSLYPALYRMEKKGWIASEWGRTETGRRARVYSLTPEGEIHLGEERENWQAFSGAMKRIVGGRR